MTKKQEHIVIIGNGKVAHHLGLQLKNNGNNIKGVWARNKVGAKNLSNLLETEVISSLIDFPKRSLAIICVADHAIAEIVNQLAPNIKIAYTSGSVRIEDLPPRVYLGVFYPLQTFSQEKEVDISIVPFLIEATDKDFQNELQELAKTLSSRVIIANSEDRYNTHIAAVMV